VLHRRERNTIGMRIAVLVLALAFAAPAVARPLQEPPVPAPTPTPTPTATPGSPDFAEITWHHSRALGKPFSHGRLVDGVQLPELGEDFFTWDPVFNRIPNRPERRWGTDALIRTVLTVIHAYRTANDSVARVGIMDLSREHGGPFGPRYGGLGHSSHQNGLDADILYPRVDGLEKRAYKVELVDQRLAQDLVDDFVAAGVQKIFVGPRLHLHGPKKIVIPLVHHDDHMHVRIADPGR
jgi:murein endopeptidase